MRRVILTGRIHPERATLTVPMQHYAWQGADGNEQGSIRFSIDYNQVVALLEWPNTAEDDDTLRNFAKAQIETITRVVGFLHGLSWEVEITGILDATLTSSMTFGIGIPVLQHRYRKEGVGQLISAVHSLCFGEHGVYLRRCLDSLGMAMRHASDTPFYCYRAIESLKQHFATVGKIDGDRNQWEAMSTSIGGNIAEVDPIREMAFPARHGVPKPISDIQRARIFSSTWDVVERFIDYRLRESGAEVRLSQFRRVEEERPGKGSV